MVTTHAFLFIFFNTCNQYSFDDQVVSALVREPFQAALWLPTPRSPSTLEGFLTPRNPRLALYCSIWNELFIQGVSIVLSEKQYTEANIWRFGASTATGRSLLLDLLRGESGATVFFLFVIPWLHDDVTSSSLAQQIFLLTVLFCIDHFCLKVLKANRISMPLISPTKTWSYFQNYCTSTISSNKALSKPFFLKKKLWGYSKFVFHLRWLKMSTGIQAKE